MDYRINKKCDRKVRSQKHTVYHSAMKADERADGYICACLWMGILAHREKVTATDTRVTISM